MPGPLDGVRTIEGTLDASGMRFAIVVSRFNAFITAHLLEGAVDSLRRLGAAPADITVAWVPGSWELPQTAARLLRAGGHDALIALGCLMRGDTMHFDLIAGEVASSLGTLGREGDVPVLFGVLTTDTLEQAIHRAGAKAGNKGAEVAQAAVEQVSLYRALSGAPRPGRAKARRSKKG
jgi:6,7-dimethyl-8-ribityllumazine synthase